MAFRKQSKNISLTSGRSVEAIVAGSDRDRSVDPTDMEPERCNKCSATSFVPLSEHVCDPLAVASHGKSVCIDCLQRGSGSAEEMECPWAAEKGRG